MNFHRPFHLKISEHQSAVDATRADITQEDNISVYPVSSQGGYVIYHVGSTLSQQSEEDFQSYNALISGTDPTRDEMMTNSCVDATSLDFPIDAFGAHLDTNVAPRGKTTVPSVSIQRHSDDGTQRVTHISDGDSGRGVDNSAESIVEQIIGEIIDSAFTRCLGANSDCSMEKPPASIRCDLSHRSSEQLSNGLDYDDDAPHQDGDSADYQSDLSGVTTRTSAASVSPTMHPLYAHILLYVRKFDTNRAMYALSRLRAILATSPNVIVRALTTSNVGGASTPRAVLLQSLLVRHRRSVLGRRFGTDDTESSTSGIRSSMFIDVLVTICLYYVRGYYPNLLAPSLTALDIADNARLQVSAADILTTVLDELAVITRTGGRGFATYIFDLLDKCKVS